MNMQWEEWEEFDPTPATTLLAMMESCKEDERIVLYHPECKSLSKELRNLSCRTNPPLL